MTLLSWHKATSLCNPRSLSSSALRKETVYAGESSKRWGLSFYSSVKYKHVSHHPVWSQGDRECWAQDGQKCQGLEQILRGIWGGWGEPQNACWGQEVHRKEVAPTLEQESGEEAFPLTWLPPAGQPLPLL